MKTLTIRSGSLIGPVGRLLGLTLVLASCASDEPDVSVISLEMEALAASYTSAWNSGEPEQVAGFYAADGVLTINDGEPAAGRAAVEAVAREFMSAFPDLELTNDRLEIDGDRIAYYWTFRGTNAVADGTGNPVEFSGREAWILTEEGLIADSIGSFDAQDYERQLYAQPAALQAMGLSVFPADYSLNRSEDGVALEDGSLLVVDQVYGLRKLRPDGSSEPFGKMNLVGYSHDPEGVHGGANGMSLEPAGTHVLVADIFGGGIYRIALDDGQASKIYQHTYGVNVAVRDSSGAIWFTQSAHNPAERGEELMWAAIDKPLVQGAIYRIPMVEGRLAFEAELVEDGFQFANGIAIDESRKAFYLAESSALRVSRFDLDVASGALGNRTSILEGVLPDNIELDSDGSLWIGAPLPNNVFIWDPETGEITSVFPDATPEREALMDEWRRRRDAGESLMPLAASPTSWAPFPGFVTGIIHGAVDGKTYFSGLMNTLIVMDSVPVPAASP